MNASAPRLLYVVTHPVTARHLMDGQLAWMRGRGFDVAVAAAPGPDLEEVGRREGVTVFPVGLAREMAPSADIRALGELLRIMREWRPDVVNAGTPKGGLLGMLAARLAGVPVRVYTLRGLRLETTSGITRLLLGACERVASACAHRVIPVSESLAQRYLRLGLARPGKVRVAGPGSSNGVRAERFANTAPAATTLLLKRLGVPPGVPVIGFVGRFTRDKGMADLVQAFQYVRERHPGTRLLLVGDFEDGDPVPAPFVRRIREDPMIVAPGFVSDPAPYYGLMDVLAFPSYREGFPNVPLEAAAAGIPVVGYRATGTVDAVVDGVTGTLVETGDTAALAEALARYLGDPELRRAHGEAGRSRATNEFQPERVWGALLEVYQELLAGEGRAEPGPAGTAEARRAS